MRNQTFEDAMAAAKGNAEWFKRPYAVFTDTSGNWRSEAYVPSWRCHAEARIVRPDEDYPTDTERIDRP